jgi:hypothetical protein
MKPGSSGISWKIYNERQIIPGLNAAGEYPKHLKLELSIY